MDQIDRPEQKHWLISFFDLMKVEQKPELGIL